MSILRIEPFSGVSGDLFAGALAQLADAEATLTELPARLGLEGVSTHWETVDKCGISCRKVSFHEAQPDPHGHRHLSHILEMIQEADLPEGAKQRAADMFTRLGEAEAAVHGIPIEKVHFHEVGAIDSIMDIVSAALLLDHLQITTTYCDPVVTGKGFAQMAHGRFPIPAPATQKLLQGMVIDPGVVEAELTTPTGAAILRHLNPCFTTPPLRLQQSAVAGASKDFDHPNILRLSLCAAGESASALLLLQTNIDDMPGELLGSDLIKALLERGARDAWLAPLLMKKGRPGHKLELLCDSEKCDGLADFILEETTSIGLRILPVTRRELAREAVQIQTPWGSVQAKKVILPSGKTRITPEYDDCLRLARASGESPLAVYQSAINGAST